jgi:hypothetical protein
MNLSLLAGFLWLIVANLIAMFPSRDHHWRNAYRLIALGVPVLGWITYVNGPLLGLLFLAGGASVLRWPVWFLWKWLKGLVGSPE